jgi:hypothetical protein
MRQFDFAQGRLLGIDAGEPVRPGALRLNLGQTIFFSLVILGLIATCVWVAMPDRAKRKSNPRGVRLN